MRELLKRLHSILFEIVSNSHCFFADILLVFDEITILTFILLMASINKFLGLEMAFVLAIFALVRGAGHLWGLRQCDVLCGKMRFLPFLGGYVQTKSYFERRWDEGFSSLGASILVLIFSLITFSLYLITGNFTCLLFSVLSFGLNLFALIPIVDLDGTAVVKSVSFSISRSLGLSFMFFNIFAMPALLYWMIPQVDPIALSPLFIGGIQRFKEEYCDLPPIEPMSKFQIRKLSGLYLVIFLSFLLLPKIFGISTLYSGMNTEISSALSIGIISLSCLSVLESNIIFFLTLKRWIFSKF